MTIDSADALIHAMANNSSRIVIEKASISNAAAGQFESLWRATGQPGQGAIPTAVAVCDNTTVGGIGFIQQTAPATSYLGILEGLCTNAGTTLEIHDRLAHFGGLVNNVSGNQTVNLDLDPLLGSSNIATRIGNSNYSDVQWWLEWYVDTGASSMTSTIDVTYNDGSTGDLTGVILAANRRASSMVSLNSLIPAAAAGKYIRAVNSVSNSLTGAIAGNFGVTATRYRAGMYKPVANARFTSNWADLGLPEISNASCLFLIQLASTTTTGVVRATGKIIHG